MGTESDRPVRTTTRAPWARFGLLDLVVLVFAVGLGMGLTKSLDRESALRPPQALIVVTLLGWTIFGPLALSTQFIRGRRAILSVGEWFWIWPIITTALQWFALGKPYFEPYSQAIMCIVSLSILPFALADKLYSAPCPWSDLAGLLNGLLLIPGIVAFVWLTLHG